MHESDGTCDNRSLLQVAGLRGGYSRGVPVLHGLAFELHAGRSLSILGPNGAGKSSILRALSGVLPWTVGSIRFRDLDLLGVQAHARPHLGVVQVPEGRGLFESLTVLENLVVCRPNKRSGRTAVPVDELFELFPRLADRRHQEAGSLSGGEQQMLSIARAMRFDPALLLLDEPSVGLAPQMVQTVFDAIGTAMTRNVSVILVEQMVSSALSLTDEVIVLVGGQVALTGPAGDVNEGDVAGVYLQVEEAGRD